MSLLLDALLWFAAIGSGLVGGVFFAFSTFIMGALARTPQAHGLSAMQSINSTILSSLFMPLFFGTTLASIALTGVALWRWGAPGSAPMLAAGLIYLIGMFICTAACNVPLNNGLAAVDPASGGAKAVWSRYVTRWTRWNHVRTVASVLASSLFITALLQVSR